MKRAGYLFEQMSDFATLLIAARRARRSKGGRHSVARFLFHLESELLALQDELRAGTYRLQPYHTFTIYEPKRRQICAAAFRDRVVQHAICHVLDPLFEATFIHDTYACRRGKGTHAAVQRAQACARRWPYVLQGDIYHYFESIDHAVLKALLRRKLKDRAVLALLDHIIEQPVPGSVPGQGVPIGNLTSQYFANFYLSPLDHLIKDHLRCPGYIRYMDDILLFAADKPALHTMLATVRTFVDERLHLRLKDPAVRVLPVTQGISFLDFRIFPDTVRLDGRKWAQWRRRVRQRQAAYRQGKIDTPTLLRSVASLVGHVQHADTLAARRHLWDADSLL